MNNHESNDQSEQITYVEGPMDGLAVSRPPILVVWDRTPPKARTFMYDERLFTHPSTGLQRAFLVLATLSDERALEITLGRPDTFWA